MTIHLCNLQRRCGMEKLNWPNELSSRLPRLAVGPERTRISYYAALTNTRVCGFQ
jgi:hypothetical protein